MTVNAKAMTYDAKTKTGKSGIFVDENLREAEKYKAHYGRYVKVVLKSGLKLERQINDAFIKGLQLGLFKVITDLKTLYV